MPVKKYRSVEEMETEERWYEPGSPELFRAMQEVWNFADQVLKPSFPPGVYKHRSIEDAEKLREEWEKANFEAYQARQAAKRREI